MHCFKIVRKEPTNMPRYFSMALIGLTCAVIATAPVAMTEKYQSWCNDINSCIFVDSRISYLAFGVFLAGFLAALIKLTYRIKMGTVSSALFSIVLGGVGAMSYLNNLRIEHEMKSVVSAWDRAKYLACFPEKVLSGLNIASIIEPKRLLSYHPDFDIGGYWKSYINDQRQKVDCSDNPAKISHFYPVISLGSKLSANESGSLQTYLLQGWSTPEGWGTWATGKTAEIILPIQSTPNEISLEIRAFLTPSHPFQRVTFKINGISTAEHTIATASNNLIDISIPEIIKTSISQNGFVSLELELPNAISPKELNFGDDNRTLSIGILAITMK